jgi:LEA14-like dessication related protein
MSYFHKVILYLGVAMMMNSCSLFQSIEVGEVEGIYLTELGRQKITLELLIPIENYNSLNFKISSINLDVIINGEKLGRIMNVGEVIITGKSAEVYHFPLDVEYSGSNILRGALTMFTLFLERQVDVRISGDIQVKSFFFSKKIQVDESNVVILKTKDA